MTPPDFDCKLTKLKNADYLSSVCLCLPADSLIRSIKKKVGKRTKPMHLLTIIQSSRITYKTSLVLVDNNRIQDSGSRQPSTVTWEVLQRLKQDQIQEEKPAKYSESGDKSSELLLSSMMQLWCARIISI